MLMSPLGNQEESFSSMDKQPGTALEKVHRSKRDIVLRNNGTISALGRSQSTGTENIFIVPRIAISCIVFMIESVYFAL